MVNAIGSANINPIKTFNALNAFKAIDQVQDKKTPDVSDGININDKSILETQNLEEIKQFAKTAGEESLSNDDIQYGLTYGRSVIADFVI